MASTQQNSSELFYVGINHKNELRRAILESSKEMIQALKAYRHIKDLETQKTDMIHDLNHIMADVRKLDNKLKSQLPKLSLPTVKPKSIDKSKSQTSFRPTSQAKSQPIPAVMKPKLSEVDKLEQELMEIENKLKRLR